MDGISHYNYANVGSWTLALLILGIWLALGFTLLPLLFSRIRHSAARPSFQFENMLLKSLPIPIYILMVVGGIMVSSRFAPLVEPDEARVLMVTKILLLLASVFLVDNLLQGLLKDIEASHSDLKSSHVFFAAIIHMVIWPIGLMILLDSLGISITPLIASLGIGSLAAALAFQNTLANLFSGFYLLVDKPIRAGHFIKLSSGEEGIVEIIGWRSTQILTLNNHMVILPNSKLAENLIQNYSLPEPQYGFSVEVGVEYDSDLEKIEEITLAVAKNIQKTTAGSNPNYEPSVCFHDFGNSSIQFSVNLQAASYPDTFFLKHVFIKALHERYRTEKVRTPYPVQSIEFRNSPSPDALKDRNKGT